jgi:hypothetical protein
MTMCEATNAASQSKYVIGLSPKDIFTNTYLITSKLVQMHPQVAERELTTSGSCSRYAIASAYHRNFKTSKTSNLQPPLASFNRHSIVKRQKTRGNMLWTEISRVRSGLLDWPPVTFPNRNLSTASL